MSSAEAGRKQGQFWGSRMVFSKCREKGFTSELGETVQGGESGLCSPQNGRRPGQGCAEGGPGSWLTLEPSKCRQRKGRQGWGCWKRELEEEKGRKGRT